MSLICLVSAKGAPGTTTTAMLLAALWPRQSVLVDADPMGGDVALRLPSVTGTPLRTDAGLLSLLPAARRGLTPDVVVAHCQEAQGGQLVISGLEGPEQASAVGGLWDEIGQSFATLPGRDVIVDAGQAHAIASTLPMLRRATVVVFVVQPSLTGVVHARQRIAALLPELTAPDGHAPVLGFVVAQTAKARSADTDTAIAEVQGTLDSLRFFGSIAHDRPSARMFEGSPQRHPERSILARSGAAVVNALVDVLPELRHDEPAAADGDKPTPVVPEAPAKLRGRKRRGGAAAAATSPEKSEPGRAEVAPAEKSEPTPTAAVAPAEEARPVPTETPQSETPEPVSADAASTEKSEPDPAEAPLAETPEPDPAEAPPAETPQPDPAEAPLEETPEPDPAEAPLAQTSEPSPADAAPPEKPNSAAGSESSEKSGPVEPVADDEPSSERSGPSGSSAPEPETPGPIGLTSAPAEPRWERPAPVDPPAPVRPPEESSWVGPPAPQMRPPEPPPPYRPPVSGPPPNSHSLAELWRAGQARPAGRLPVPPGSEHSATTRREERDRRWQREQDET